MPDPSRVVDRRSLDLTPFAGAARKLAADPRAWIETKILIADLVRNAREPIPELLLKHLVSRLDGVAKKKQGRGRGDLGRKYREIIIAATFERYLTWLANRSTSQKNGLTGWKNIRQAEWWQGPPSERAARMTKHRVARSITWEAVQNIAYKVRKGNED